MTNSLLDYKTRIFLNKEIINFIFEVKLKKILYILLISCFGLSIFSCKKEESDDSSEPTNKLLGGTIQGIALSLTGKVTTIVGPFAGSTDSGSTDGTGNDARFYIPAELTSNGIYLYVVEYGNNKIRRIE